MTIECAPCFWLGGTRDMWADLGDDGGAERYVGDEVAVHYVYLG